MSEILRLGLVGCGGISRSLYVNLLAGFAERARVVAVCDVVAERGRERSQQFQDTYQQLARDANQRSDGAATVEDVSTASLRYASGALGHATTTTCAHENEAVDYDRVEIFGEKASLKVSRTVDYSTTSPLLRHGTKFILSVGSSDETYAREVRTFLDETIPPRDEDMQVTQFRRFLDAVENDGPVPVLGESARKHVELVRGTYKSALTHSIVAMPLPPDDPFYGPEGTASAAAPL